jgi:anti-anti-sigma factor
MSVFGQVAQYKKADMEEKVSETTVSAFVTEKIGGRLVVTPKEPLTHQNCEQLGGVFEKCMNQGQSEIILDCKAVSYLDSAGLEFLCRMHDALKARGGALKIIETGEVCRDILVATRLINVFFVYENINQAMRSEQ